MDKGYMILMTGCSNDCIFCAVGKSWQMPEDFLENQLKQVQVRTKELQNVKEITISGSDPIEYDQLVPLIKKLRSQGCEVINLATHGRHLKDKALTKQLADLGVEWFSIPVYGGSAEFHDKVTQVKGSFEETMEGIRNVKASGKKVAMTSHVLNPNKENMLDIVKLSASIPCEAMTINMTYMTIDKDDFYVPTKDLGKCLSPVYEYYLKEKIPLSFIEIPYCVFSSINPKELLKAENIYHRENKFKDLGDKSKSEDVTGSKVKVHLKMCHSCAAFDQCDGFFKKDIDKFGVGDLKPLPK